MTVSALIRSSRSIAVSGLPVQQPSVATALVSTPLLVVFDSRVTDLDVLYQGLLPGAIAYTLNDQDDALSVITQLLTETGATRLAIVAHGEPGVVHLGATPLNREQVQARSALLQEWDVEEIVLYSCEVAKGEPGRSFIDQLSELTGAKIAASATKTGCVVLGGDWQLEVSTGNISTSLVFEPEAMSVYNAVLAADDLDPTFSTDGKVTTDFSFTTGLLEKAISLTEDWLQNFAQDSNFSDVLKESFGDRFNWEQAEAIRQSWATGDFTQLPIIKVQSGSVLQGANGAYAAKTNQIYLSQNYLKANVANPEAIANVLLEEIGHFVDAKINTADSSGDEGAIFSALIREESLTAETLVRLKVEDDASVINLNGQAIAVEQQNFTGDNGNNTITGTSSDDTINSGLGSDNVDGGAGDDLLIVDYSSNTVSGMYGGASSNGSDGFNGGYYAFNGSSYDTVSFSNVERFQIAGTGADDNIYTGDGNDTIVGGAGNDTLNGQGGNDTISGGSGNDVISGGDGINVIDGGEGIDTLVDGNFSSATSALNLDDTDSSKTLTVPDGTSVSNIERFTNLTTGSGNDVISFSQRDNNTINTGSGDDTINAGLGSDSVDGGAGDDLLIVDYSSNTVSGMYGGASSIGADGFNGGYYAFNGSSYDTVSFSNIERFQITGTDTDDTIYTGDGNDTISGGAGNDTLYGQGGSDTINGGSGNDVISSGDGNDVIDGGVGNDVIDGGTGVNVIDGGEGIDTLVDGNFGAVTEALTINDLGTTTYAPINLPDGTSVSNIERFTNLTTGSGNDVINFSQRENNTLNTGSGDDTINSGLGFDNVDGGSGNDLLIVDYSSNTVGGMNGGASSNGSDGFNGGYQVLNGSGYDYVSFSNIERFQITGTDTDDTIYTGDGNDTLVGGAGNDTLYGQGGSDTINGGSGNDVISSGDGNDVIDGGVGNDVIDGGTGVNVIDGGEGIDTLVDGNFGAVTEALTINDLGTTTYAPINLPDGTSVSNIERFTNLTTGSGNDVINFSQRENNTLNTGSGDDTINSGLGFDNVDGGSGNDLLIVDYSSNTVGGMNGGASSNGSDGFNGGYQVLNGSGYDYVSFSNIERFQITGTDTDDTIYTGDGNDTLVGGAGNDTLYGQGGSDTINGGSGNDVISSGDGNDVIDGGVGNDVIDGGTGVNVIDGGEGIDTLVDGNFGAVTEALTINDLGTTTYTSINLPDGTSVSNIERFTNLTTGSGNDVINFSQRENNTLNTGSGDDTINAGLGNDSVDGGAGDDLLIVDYSGNTVSGMGGSTNSNGSDGFNGYYQAYNGSGYDTVSFSNIERFQITGTDTDDNIYTGNGNDTLVGGAGNDTLYGQGGSDRLIGVAQNAINPGLDEIDILQGGADGDIYVIGNAATTFYDDGNATTAGTADYARIVGFNPSEDLIQLTGPKGNYLLGVSPINGISGTAIYINKPNGEPDELIAIIEEVTGLDLNSNVFIEAQNQAGLFSFSQPTFSTPESSNATVTITRVQGTAGAASVTLALTNGTATAPSDYDNRLITVDFANGESSKTITIPIANDTIYELNETVNLILVNPTGGAALGTQKAATLAIVNDDPFLPGEITFNAANYSINEDGTSTTQVTLTRIGGSDGEVSVTLIPSNGSATVPDDYNNNPITVSFADGEISKIVTIPLVDDSQFEPNETVNLTLTNPTGGATLGAQQTAILTIINNDVLQPGILAFSDPTYSINEDGTTTTQVTVTRTGGTDGEVSATINLTDGTATTPTDYTGTSLTVNFANGETNKTVTIPISIVNDSVYEGDETVNLTLGNPTGGATLGSQSGAVLTIVDNDLPDLVVSNIVAPIEGLAGQSVEVAWTVTNQGNTDVTGTWTDSVYLSADQQVGDDQPLGGFSFTGTIAAGQSITRQQLVTLPTNVSGDRWVVVQTDAGNQIIESVDDNNTVVDSQLISLKLPPSPNLKVAGVSAPPTALSGGQATVEWAVTNVGTGATNAPAWYDSVWLSLDNIYDNTDTFLGQVANPSYLNLGESYTNQLTVSLPQGIANNYHFIVKTDENNQVEELNNEGDNFGASAPTDIQPSPVSDLQVTSTNAPTQAFSGQSLSLTWTVGNEGQGKTLGDSWYDAVYMSTDTTLDNQDKRLGLVLHTSEYEYFYDSTSGLRKNLIRSGVLGSNESYNVTQNFALPIGISGDFFFLVQTDASNQVFEGAFDINNVGYDPIATRVTLTPPPDLEVESIDVSTTALASNPFTINYRVTNFGATATPNYSWQDAFYLSTDDQLDLNTDLFLGTQNHSGVLEAGESYDGSATFTLPNGLEGNHRVFVVTDSQNTVFELDNANNVSIGADAIAISSRPADLIVSTAGISGTAEAGKALRVNWTVANQGTGNTAVENWTDRIYISPDGIFDSSDTLLGSFNNSSFLNAGASYTRNELVELPFNLTGDYNLFVVTDTINSVYEAANEGNNSSLALPVTVNRQTPDLRVTQLNAPITAQSGEAFTVNWTVENQGIARTNVDFWYDQVYLSLDSVISDDDISLVSDDDIGLRPVYHAGALDPAASYQTSKTFRLPTDLTGQFHVLVRTDSSANVIEGSLETNNDQATSSPTTITLGAVPDLVVQNVNAPATAISNQQFSLTWTVQNNGAATGARTWRDAFYLSRDQFFDRDSDIFLGYQNHVGDLGAGESYTQTQAFEIPRGLSGPYYVFAATDNGKDIYERSGEQNNIGYDGSSMQVNLPAPADLSVSSITVPATGVSGKGATVTYTVTNQGANAAEGGWWDSVYLSQDNQWDISDPLIGQIYHTGGVAGGASYTETLEAPLPGALPGNYNVIVRSDIRNQIPEVNEVNNIQASVNQVALTVDQLQLDTLTEGTLAKDKAVYYRIDVAAGETLQVKLDDPGSNGINELYIRYGEMPTRSQFDVAGSSELSADQQVVVPTTRAGTYYVLAYGNSVSAEYFRPYTIQADILDFSILGIGKTHGSNLGQVTTTISGAKFTPDSVIKLIAADGSDRIATKVWWKSDTELWATFDLKGLTTGLYDVQVEGNGKTTVLNDSFTVNDGPIGKVEVGLNVPSALRPEQTGIVTVAYTNTGETDVVAPIIQLVADNAELSQSVESGFGGNVIEVLGISSAGPAGVLAPGETGYFNFRFRPTVDARQSVNFGITTLEATDDLIDLTSIKESSRPETIDSTAWNAIWQNFNNGIGTTVRSYLEALSENATHLSLIDQRTSNTTQLLSFELQQASNKLVGSTLATAVDHVDAAPGFPLTFSRSFNQTLAERYELGTLGRGWSHSWNISLIVDSENEVIIDTGSGRRMFIQQEDGSYLGIFGDRATLSQQGGIYRLTEQDGSFTSFRSDGRLDFVEDTNNNRITTGYASSRLTSLTHSNGDSLTLSYNNQGRINQITDSTGRVTTYNYNASGDHLLSVTTPEGTTGYTYETGQGAALDHTLKSITYVDGTQRTFGYDNQGRLIQESGSNGSETLTYQYDSSGAIRTTNNQGDSVQTLLNDLGVAGQVIDALGRSLQIVPDPQNNRVSLVEPDGATYTYSYDANGNLTSQTNPLGQQVNFSYDQTFNQLQTVQDARNNPLNYSYDAKGNLTATTYADGTREQFSYDSIGNVSRYTNRRNQTIDYTYSKDGLVTGKTFSDGTTVTYGYDTRGNVTSTTDTSGTTLFNYNSANQISRVTYPNGRFLEYSYDSVGRRTHLENQDGFAVNYSYDSNGRLERLTNANNELVVRYEYDNVGRLAKETKGNGTSSTYEYDNVGQLTHLVHHGSNGSVNSRFDYTYNAQGLVSNMTTLEGATAYEYDAIGQLTHVSLPTGRAIQYRYDAAGNRITVADSGVTTNYAANNLNQYTQVGNGNYAYDADGNLISKTENGQTWTYSYNTENRLIQVETLGNTWEYEYNAFGARTATSYNGQRTEYLVDPTGLGDVVAEYSGSTNANYIHGLGLESQTQGSNTAYFDFDALGSTSGLTGLTGNYLNSYSYLPFGESLSKSETIQNSFEYVGQWGIADEGNGLNFMRARYYDNSNGRLISVDPIGLSSLNDYNLYAYANNNPIIFNDPTGLCPQPNTSFEVEAGFTVAPNLALIGGFVGGGVSVGVNSFGQGYVKVRGSVGPAVGAYAGGGLSVGVGGSTSRLNKGWNNSHSGRVEVNAGYGAAGGSSYEYDTAGGVSLPLPTQRPLTVGVGAGAMAGAGYSYAKTYPLNDPNFEFPCPDPNPAPGPIPVPAPTPGPTAQTQIVRAFDPNDIIGPAGFGEEKWISSSALLPYTIRFENRATATAPAQQVTVTHPLDADLDWRTFRLGNFGWGDLTFEVPANTAFYTQRLDLTDKLGFLVDVVAGIDIIKGEAFWTLTTIDPATGEIPVNPLIGFLPPDNQTTENPDGGLGDGFINYTIKAKRDVATGAVIDAKATIIFDTEEPIDTPPIFNTIDAGKPTSTVNALPTAAAGEEFLVSWSGNDGTNGSALANFTIYISDNGAPFTPWLENTKLTEATYIGEPGHTYAFYSVARDNAGNIEAAPTTPDAQIRVPGSAVANGTIAFSATEFSVNEDGTPIIAVTVTRTNGSDGSVGATITLTDGTATAPADYTNAPITVDFIDGETTKTVIIPIVNDTLFENDESIALTLGNPTGGATIGTQTTATLTISNDDALAIVNPLPDLNTAEDTTFNFTVPTNTFNTDASVNLTYTATLGNGDPLPVWLSFNPTTRSFNGTPTNDHVGNFSVRVTATDSSGTSASDIFGLTVTNTNDAPVVSNAIVDQSATEDRAFSFTLPANTFADADGDALTYTATLADDNPLPAWLTFDAATRTFNGTPDNGNIGSLNVKVTATDGSGLAASDVFALAIANINDAPALTGTLATLARGTEDTAYTIAATTLLQGFTDADGDLLSIADLTATSGSLIDNSDGTYSFTPTANFNGTVNLTYNVTDGNGGVTAASQSLAIASINDPVTGSPTAILTAGVEDTAYTVTAATLLQGFSDVDSATNGQSLSITNLVASNGTLALNPDGISWTVTPATNFNGNVTLTYDVSDSNGSTLTGQTRSFNLVGVNDAPLATGTATLAAIDEGILAPSGATVNSLFAATFSDSADQVMDGSSANPFTGIAIVGNAAPSTQGVWQYSSNGTSWTTVSTSVTNTSARSLSPTTLLRFLPTTNFSGTPGTLSVRLIERVSVTNGALINVSINGGSTAYSATTVGLNTTITPINDAPVLAPASVKSLTTIKEDPTTNPGTPVSTFLGTSVTDVDVNALRGIAVTSLAGSDNGTWQYSNESGSWLDFGSVSATSALLLSGSTLVRFIPTLNYNGSVSLTYRAWDQTSGIVGDKADPGIGGGSSAFSTAIATSNLTITSVNDAPTLTDPKATLIAGTEDTLYTLNATDLLAGFSDVEGNTLSVANLKVTNGTLSVYNPTTATWSFTPTANYNGTVNLSYSVVDGKGGILAATQSFIVTPINDAPVLTTTSVKNLATIQEDSTLNSGTLVSTLLSTSIKDADINAVRGVAVTDITGSDNGIWQYSSDGINWTNFDNVTATNALLLSSTTRVRFNPALNYNGSSSLSYRAWDQTFGMVGSSADTSNNGGNTAFSTTIATSNLTITPVNDAPVNGVPIAQSVNEDTILVFSSANGNPININDVDAGNNPLRVTLSTSNGTLQLVNISGLGTITGNGTPTLTVTGSLTNLNTALDGLNFTPKANFNGNTTLRIATNDLGYSGSVAALGDVDAIGITVNAINDALINTLPTTPQTVLQGSSLVLSSSNRISISDVDASGAIAKITLSVSHGKVGISNSSGLTEISGNNTGSLTFQGTVSGLNSALNGLRFTPDAEAVIAGSVNLTIISSDLGNTGAGGVQTDMDILAIGVNAANPIQGTADNDILTGSSLSNFIQGFDGDDIINGNSGQDIIFGGTGNDTIRTGSGNDFVDAGFGDDSIYLSGGQDTLVLTSGNGVDTIYGYAAGSTRFKLSAGLNYSDLSLVQSGDSTLIHASNEILAALDKTQANTLSAGSFI